ncbi:hypothetical protein ACFORJ_09670 [Corynebacterium hansenii]|uniref:Lipoprotein LpqE n=1 Tax=Corynebacterium hansenii TaxID=394964 RepID=A0ABV7ZSS0_9CORY|nr:hypothetical protein [Corynebacterium hansenii]WJZ01020.1 hypothetical protein CHAN_12175 [Corynebacterium hansenii]
MTLKSVVRRGALATVAAASAVALAACGAGQVSQTANQVAAVDGAQNEQDAIPGGVAIRDAHIVVDPESGDAALKFSVTNQERANDVVYTLKSIDVEGVGDVKLTPVASTKSYEAAKKGDRSIPRDCQLVADYAGAVEKYSKAAAANQACITYMSTSLDSKTLTGEKTSAAGENRNVTFTFEGPKGTEKIEMFVTISPYVPEAGAVNRGKDGMAEGAKAAESTAGKTADGNGDAETSSATDPYTGQIYQ